MPDTAKRIKMLAAVVILGGIAGVLGWVFDINLFKSISPSFVTMKLSTAVSFVLSGAILYLLPDLLKNKSPWPQVIMPGAVLVILLLMTTLLASSLFGIRTGLEDIIIPEGAAAVSTTTPGRPSIMTMTDFLLIAFTGLAALFLTGWLPKMLRFTGIMLTVTGLMAQLGYVTGIELLYYHIEDLSTAMAIHTAFLFILLGAGFFLSHSLAVSER